MSHCSGCGNFYKRVESHIGFCELYKANLKRKSRDDGIEEGKKAAKRAAQMKMKQEREKWAKETDAAVLRKELEIQQQRRYELEKHIIKLSEERDEVIKQKDDVFRECIDKIQNTKPSIVYNIDNRGQVHNNMSTNINKIKCIQPSYEKYLSDGIKALGENKLLKLKPSQFLEGIQNTYQKAIEESGFEAIEPEEEENKALINSTKEIISCYAESHPNVKGKIKEFIAELDGVPPKESDIEELD